MKNDLKSGDVEKLTQSYGREIFTRIGRSAAVPFSPNWWDERLMEWSMGDESIKLQLFRFVDVLPLLHSPEAIARHLREYFGEAQEHLPGWLRLSVRWLPSRGLLGRMLAATAYRSAQRLARKFIAGSNLDEALDAIAELRRRSLAFTIDRLGEATITEQEAEQAQGDYLDLIRGLSRQVNSWRTNDLIDRDLSPHPCPPPQGGREHDSLPPCGGGQGWGESLPRVNVSVKLSALYSQFDPIDPEGTSQAVRRRLRPILHAAREEAAFVNIDMEQYAFKDLTLQIFREVLEEDDFRDWPDAGIAIQAYLRDTARDLEELAALAQRRGMPVTVRLVKGAYWDYETIMSAQLGWPNPVWSRKWETDSNYEKLTAFLIDNRRWLRPALGSHNIRSLAHALALAHVRGLPPGSLEFQMLYGMAEPIKDALVSLGQRVRVYTPYGQLLPGMAYLVRRLLENTANESFLRASFTEHLPEERLLRNPVEVDGESGEEDMSTEVDNPSRARSAAE